MRGLYRAVALACMQAVLARSVCAAAAAAAGEGAGSADAALLQSLHLDWIDARVAPLQDFYHYANGRFLDTRPIPPAYSSWGQFQALNQKNQDVIHELLEQAAADRDAKPGSEAQQLGDFFASGMDEAGVEAAGVAPLQLEFARIAAARTPADLTPLLAHLQFIGVDALFGLGAMQDFGDSTRVIAVLGQGGLGLPDRDHYLGTDPKSAALRKAYEQHIERMFVLLGDAKARAHAAAHAVMALETRLAAASMPSEEQRSPQAIYHLRDLPSLAAEVPAVDWPQYLGECGVPAVTTLNLAMPKFFAAVSRELTTTPVAQWRDYLRWQLVHAFAPFLSQAFVDENFRLVQAVSGDQELPPRWRRVLSAENEALGFAVGHAFVQRRFPPEARAQVLDILHGIRAALRADIETRPWMGDATRARALEKLALIEERIGYPEVWRDYSRLWIDRGPYVLNVLRANAFDSARELAKIGRPVDRSEWEAEPQTVNAFYSPSMNSITFLAGILQPPFFDPAAPAAVNYGAIGSVIGHEITHGFDDQGGQFDGHGNLVNWWTAEDRTRFEAGVDCIAAQFAAYTVDGQLQLKGRLVTGEAIADLGGLLLAYRAFEASPARAVARDVAGLTPEQQFFLGFAHLWGQNVRPEQARMWVAGDPHPPAIHRVNGTLANVPQFAAAFGAPGGAATGDAKRCVIW